MLYIHTHVCACTHAHTHAHNVFSVLSREEYICYQVKHYFQIIGDVDIRMLYLALFPHLSELG